MTPDEKRLPPERLEKYRQLPEERWDQLASRSRDELMGHIDAVEAELAEIEELHANCTALIDEHCDEKRCYLSNATKWCGAAIQWALDAEARRAEIEKANDPIWDATDGAHPAWWRGHDNGAEGTAKLLLRVANGELDMRGQVFSGPIGEVSQAILGLRAQLEESERKRSKWQAQYETSRDSYERQIDELRAKLVEATGRS